MSQFSTGFDTSKSRIDAILTSAEGLKKLTDAYDIPNKSELLLEQGYGLAIGPGANTHRLQSSNLSVKRDMIVTISRKIYALDEDVSAKETVTKQLIEDKLLVAKDLEINSTLNGGRIVSGYEADGGIQFVAKEQENYAYVQFTIQIEYFESL